MEKSSDSEIKSPSKTMYSARLLFNQKLNDNPEGVNSPQTEDAINTAPENRESAEMK